MKTVEAIDESITGYWRIQTSEGTGEGEIEFLHISATERIIQSVVFDLTGMQRIPMVNWLTHVESNQFRLCSQPGSRGLLFTIDSWASELIIERQSISLSNRPAEKDAELPPRVWCFTAANENEVPGWFFEMLGKGNAQMDKKEAQGSLPQYCFI